MYVNDKYVFIHHNKNAGVFVKDYMLANIPKTKVIVYKHAPLRCLPERHRKKIKIGVVRNPFEWYVSFFSYHKANGYYPKLSFEQYIRKHLDNSRGLISKAQKKNVLNKNAKIYPPSARYLDIGSCTYHYIHFFSYRAVKILKEWKNDIFEHCFPEISDMDTLFRQERLYTGMTKFFNDPKILALDRKNESKHKHYREYYTPELRRLVEKKDEALLKYYGYEY